MVPHTGAVLALIDVVLAGATPATIKQSALKCLASWLHLTPDPASTCLLTLGTYRVYAAPKNLEVSYHQAERAQNLGFSFLTIKQSALSASPRGCTSPLTLRPLVS